MVDQYDLTSRWRHRWYKCFPIDDLFGSIRHELGPAERGIWYDMRSLASISPVPGKLCESESQAYPHTRIAALLNVRLAMLEATVEKAVAMGLCTEDDTGIHILNWERSQSEYDRQKSYRQKEGKSTDPDKFIQGKYGKHVRR